MSAVPDEPPPPAVAAVAGAADVADAAKTEEAKPAPKLSDHDFKIYNHLAVRMNYFVRPIRTPSPVYSQRPCHVLTARPQHENFRRTWNLLWSYATTGKRQNGVTLKQLVRAGLDFGEHLTVHHGIEERLMFPVLAKRMPEFDHRRGDLVLQHRKIHKGLDGLVAYLEGVQRGDEPLEAGVLKEKMESWGEVLWSHLDDEVRTLGAENMAKYWSKDEIVKLRW